jgi:hypothetical protein
MNRLSYLLFLAMFFSDEGLKAQLWQGVDGGVNRFINQLYSDSVTNTIFAVGQFNNAGSNFVGCIAKFDGERWYALDSGLGHRPFSYNSSNSVIVYHSQIFAGGQFAKLDGVGLNATSYMATWDGIHWQACGNPTSPCYLSIANDNLFATGTYDSISGQAIDHIAKWNGSVWESFGSPLPWQQGDREVVKRVVYFQGAYYFAGNFEDANGGNEILKYDDAGWHSLQNGIRGSNSYINDMAVYNNLLFVAGKFLSSNGNSKDYVMAWDGQKWIDPFPDIQFWFEAYDLEVIAGKLYIVAPVTSNQIRRMHTLAHFDGTYFCIFGSGEESLLNVAGMEGRLFVSGAPNPVPPFFDIHYIAEWMGGKTTDTCIYQPIDAYTDTASVPFSFTVIPNPVKESFKIETNPAFSSFTLRIHDITGRAVAPARTYRAGDPPVDVTHLSAGLYFVEVQVKDRVAVVKLVKEN